MAEKYLAHYGTKGQKKGIRNHQSYETAPTRSGMVGEERGDAAKQRIRLSRDEKKLAKKYDYKSSDRYKNASRNEKSTMTWEHYNTARRLGRKTANKIDYIEYEKGGDRRKEKLKTIAKRGAAFLGLSLGADLADLGIKKYRLAKGSMAINNKAVEQYAKMKGLKSYDNGGFKPGFEGVKRGDSIIAEFWKRAMHQGK